MGQKRLCVFDLRDVLGNLPPPSKRAHVHDRYAPALEDLRTEIHADNHGPSQPAQRA